MGTMYRHTQVGRVTLAGMGIVLVAVAGGACGCFDDGHRFRVGSDEPDRLAEALLSAMRVVQHAARD